MISIMAAALTAAPAIALVVDAEKPSVPYPQGSPPYNAPRPIVADHVNTADGSITHDNAGLLVHPSVLDMGPDGWNGFRYWMANSDYSFPYGQEDTMILVSHDGYEWAQPPGAAPGPIWRVTQQLPAATGSNSDPELVFDQARNKIVHLVRQNGTPGTLWHSESADGISWTTPVLVFQADPIQFVSPCVVSDGAGGWVMFTWGGTPRIRTASSLTGPWSAPAAITAPGSWHAGVWRDPATGTLYGIGGDTGGSNSTRLVAFTSTDGGMTWGLRGVVISKMEGSWDGAGTIYRPTMQPHPDGIHFRIWYSVHAPHRTGYMIAPRSLWA